MPDNYDEELRKAKFNASQKGYESPVDKTPEETAAMVASYNARQNHKLTQGHGPIQRTNTAKDANTKKFTRGPSRSTYLSK